MDGTELANSGDDPALNFLNTRMKPWGEAIELLGSGQHFLDWMQSTGLIDRRDRATVSKRFSAEELDDAAAQARAEREWLRREITQWAEAAEPAEISTASQRRLNRILAKDAQFLHFDETAGVRRLRLRRSWEEPSQLLIPVVAAAAELLATGDRELIRLCDGPSCNLWFYDRTRAHRRRWCSQAVCGNRDKVRNFRARSQTG
jgi:predicted RNA-binding Zn ribbon-like protein